MLTDEDEGGDNNDDECGKADVAKALKGSGAIPFFCPQGMVNNAGYDFFCIAHAAKNQICRVEDDASVKVLCGDGVAGHRDGEARVSRFRNPRGICRPAIDADKSDLLYVADTLNHCIRKVSSVGDKVLVETVVGDPGCSGSVDGPVVRFNRPEGVLAIPGNVLLVADTHNNRIRKVRGTDTTTWAAEIPLPTNIKASCEDETLVVFTISCETYQLSSCGSQVLRRFFDSSLVATRRFVPLVVKFRFTDSGKKAIFLTDIGTGAIARRFRMILLPTDERAEADTSTDRKRKMMTEKVDVSFPTNAPYPDVLFLTRGGEELPAHRCVLASRSKYFEALFRFHGDRDGDEGGGSNAIKLRMGVAADDDVHPDVLRLMLKFLYAGGGVASARVVSEDATTGLEVPERVQLMRMADMYDLPHLRASMADEALADLKAHGSKNAVQWYLHTKEVLPSLHEEVVAYVRINLRDVLLSNRDRLLVKGQVEGGDDEISEVLLDILNTYVDS